MKVGLWACRVLRVLHSESTRSPTGRIIPDRGARGNPPGVEGKDCRRVAHQLWRNNGYRFRAIVGGTSWRLRFDAAVNLAVSRSRRRIVSTLVHEMRQARQETSSRRRSSGRLRRSRTKALTTKLRKATKSYIDFLLPVDTIRQNVPDEALLGPALSARRFSDTEICLAGHLSLFRNSHDAPALTGRQESIPEASDRVFACQKMSDHPSPAAKYDDEPMALPLQFYVGTRPGE